MAHGERMEKGEDAAAEKAEDEDKDTTILLSDEEIEQFVTVTKGKRKKHRSAVYCNLMKITERGTQCDRFLFWKCRTCNGCYENLWVPHRHNDYFPCPGGWSEFEMRKLTDSVIR